MFYVLDAGDSRILELDYRGNSLREFPGFITCLALSYSHDAVIWFQTSEIVVQGLRDESLHYEHTLQGVYLVDIIYSKDTIFWARKDHVMGIYYKQWNDTESTEEEFIRFPIGSIIQDIALVDISTQPQSGNNIYHYIDTCSHAPHTHTHTHTHSLSLSLSLSLSFF